jgi:hypothetical protein
MGSAVALPAAVWWSAGAGPAASLGLAAALGCVLAAPLLLSPKK